MHGVTCGDSLTYLPHIGTMHIHLPTLIHCKWDNPALAFITVCTSMCNSHISEDSVTRFLISNSSTPRECAIFRPLPVSANTQQQPQAWHAWNMVHNTNCTCMHTSVYPKHTNVLASHSWQRRRNYTMSHLQVSLSAVAGRNAGIIFPPLSSLWKWEGVRLCETCTLVQLQLEMYEGKAATQNFHYH